MENSLAVVAVLGDIVLFSSGVIGLGLLLAVVTFIGSGTFFLNEATSFFVVISSAKFVADLLFLRSCELVTLLSFPNCVYLFVVVFS